MHLMGVSSLFSALHILWVQIAWMYLGTPPLVNTKVNYSRFSGLPRCKGSLWRGCLQRFQSDLHFLSYYHWLKNPHLKSKTCLNCCCNNKQILTYYLKSPSGLPWCLQELRQEYLQATAADCWKTTSHQNGFWTMPVQDRCFYLGLFEKFGFQLSKTDFSRDLQVLAFSSG